MLDTVPIFDVSTRSPKTSGAEALGNVPMLIMKRMRRFLRRHTASDENGSGQSSKTRTQVEEFAAERRERLAGWTDADVDAMTQAALSGVDQDQTLREAQTLREKRQRRTGQSVRRHPE